MVQPGNPGGQPPRYRREPEVLVVRGVGEKRSAAQWAVLIGVPTVLVIVAIVLITLLMSSRPRMDVEVRTPGQPPPVASAQTPQATTPAATDPAVTTPAETTPGSTVVTEAPATTTPGASTSAPAASGAGGGGSGSWPAFRNGDRMNISKESLARSFPASGPKRLWQISLGDGHAGAAVHNGRVYVLDYNVGSRRDELICLDLNSGKKLWTQGYAVDIKNNHGISRTVPATDGKYVVTLGPMGHVMCCQASDGKVVWKKDLVKEYGTKIPTWYAGQCPLIDNNNVILAPGGKALMMAVHLPTGNVTWTTPNAQGWQMTHSSIMPVDFSGKRIYVYPASGGVVGVNARDGKLLWNTPQWTVNTSNIPTPVPVGGGKIFVCGGYNSGAAFLQMGAGGTSVSMTKRIPPNVFQSHQQTPILYNGHLYGVKVPGELVCMDLNGNIKWSSGNTARFGIGPYVMANGILYVLSDGGDLAIVEANPSSYKQLAKAKVVPGPDAWAPIAIAGRKLLCRDARTMVCLDMSG